MSVSNLNELMDVSRPRDDRFYDRCPCPAELRGNMPGSVCPLCKGVGFNEVGLTHGQVERLMRIQEAARHAVLMLETRGGQNVPNAAGAYRALQDALAVRPIGPWMPRKICSKCKKVMSRSDKWFFNDAGTVEHRNCDEPGSYQ